MIKLIQKTNGLILSTAVLSFFLKILSHFFNFHFLLALVFSLSLYLFLIKIDYSLDSKSFFAFRLKYRFQ